VRQALPQCLRGSFEFVVKMPLLDWEAAVLPLNYARKILLSLDFLNPGTSDTCQVPAGFGDLAALTTILHEPSNMRQAHASGRISVGSSSSKAAKNVAIEVVRRR
jgi:hypothetical protein